MEDVFGLFDGGGPPGGSLADDDHDGASGIAPSESGSARRGRGRGGRGRSGVSRAAAEQDESSKTVALAPCAMCEAQPRRSVKTVHCAACEGDIRAARKDAAAQGEAELFVRLEQKGPVQDFRQCLHAWKHAVGPNQGPGKKRIGAFSWAQYTHTYNMKKGLKK
eukprot:5530459-Alexandrium_andersonii.AAC.1